jgi:hypothetical protein
MTRPKVHAIIEDGPRAGDTVELDAARGRSARPNRSARWSAALAGRGSDPARPIDEVGPAVRSEAEGDSVESLATPGWQWLGSATVRLVAIPVPPPQFCRG